MIYLVVSSLVLVASFRLFDRAAGIADLRKTNMMGSIFFFTFLAQSWIASLLVVNNLDNHYMLADLIHQDSRLWGWMAINYAILIFPLGMMLANACWLNKVGAKGLYRRFLEKPTGPAFSHKDRNTEFLLLIGLVIGGGATAYTLIEIGFVGIYELIAGSWSPEALDVMRTEAKWGFGGIVYVRNLLMSILVPVMACLSYAHYLRRRTLFSMFLFLCYLALAVVALTYSFEKAPLLYFLISLGFVYLYFHGGVSWTTVIFGIGLVCALLVAMYALLTVTGIQLGYNTGPIGRILLAQSAGVFLSFDYFGRVGDFIGVSSVSQLFSNLFGFEYSERSARILMEFYNPGGVEAGVSGVISGLFIGEAWANFGLFGVIVAPLYVGFMLQSFFLVLITLRKSIVSIAILGYFSFGGALSGGLNAYFYDPATVVFFGYILSGWLLIKFLLAVTHGSAERHDAR